MRHVHAVSGVKPLAFRMRISSLDDPLAVKVFDILMLNGNCLTSFTLRKRHEVLFSKKGEYRVFQPVQGRLELADVWEGKVASDIKDRLEWVMENR